MPDEYDEIGPWSEIKLQVLRKYLAPYSQLVSAKGFYHIYIDALAGPGQHRSRTTGEIVPGSPQIALSVEPHFREYHFIEQNAVRVEQLRALSSGRDGVFVHQGNCNEILGDVLDLVQYRDYRRALCFIDPYDINLDWRLVQQAGRLQTVEIFMNFMIMDMNMNAALRNPDAAQTSQIQRANHFWGDETWKDAAYDQWNLFGFEQKADDANERLADAYRTRLVEVAGFKYASRPLAMKNRLGRTIYYLCFASPNRTGHHIVEDIFESYRRRS